MTHLATGIIPPCLADGRYNRYVRRISEPFYDGKARFFFDDLIQRDRYMEQSPAHAISLPEGLPALIRMVDEVRNQWGKQLFKAEAENDLQEETEPALCWLDVLSLIIARILRRYGHSPEGRRALRQIILKDELMADIVFDQIATMEMYELADLCVDLAFVSTHSPLIISGALEALVDLEVDLRPFRAVLYRYLREDAPHSYAAACALCQMKDMRGWNYLIRGLFSTDNGRFAATTKCFEEMSHRIVPPRWVVNRIIHWMYRQPQSLPPYFRSASFEAFMFRRMMRFLLRHRLTLTQKVALFLTLQQKMERQPDEYHKAFRYLAYDVLIWARAQRCPSKYWFQIELPPAQRPYIHPSHAPLAGILRTLVQRYKGVDIYEELGIGKPRT